MLVDSMYDGKSAAEILEETKKYYVKTRELKENKIDLSTPRLFKSPSEEEMEQIVSELRTRPSIKHPVPFSSALRVTQSFCSPRNFGTAFCITGSAELPNRMQSFTTSATSAFEPVIRIPPRPPKSEKVREKQSFRVQLQPEIASTSSNLELPPRPIPPPRRSLQKSNSRPIPPPRQRITMTTSYHSPSNFAHFEPITSSENASNNLSNALSSPNLMSNSICCSAFEPYNNSMSNQVKTENDLMTASWYGPLTASTKLQLVKQIPHRIRIPVKPNQLTVTVVGQKSPIQPTITQPKLIKPVPVRSPDSALKVNRSQSSVTPSRSGNFHSPGTTSGAGTTSGTSVSNPSVAEFQTTQNAINKHILSSPTASKDSGAHDCSIIGSEIDEPEIKHVDKDFEERIKRWDSCSAAHQPISSPPQVFSRPTKPPPIAPKPVISSNVNNELAKVNKFFDRCGVASLNGSISDVRLNNVEDAHEISSVDSNFTSITNNNVALDKDQARDDNESDGNHKSPSVASKPVSMIEKNARVIQWIHGCTLASTVC